MGKNVMTEVTSDLAIIDVHILNLNILASTILFLLLRYNKHFNDPKLKDVITIIAILFCFAGVMCAIYAIIAAVVHRKKNNVTISSVKELFSARGIMDEIPIVMSVVLCIISLLLFYTVIHSSLDMIF